MAEVRRRRKRPEARAPAWAGALLVAVLGGCASAPPKPRTDVFAIEGTTNIMRPGGRESEGKIRTQVAFLHRRYGYLPNGSFRDLRDLRDLLDHRRVLDALWKTPALPFGEALVRLTGYRFRPDDARALETAAEGAAGKAMAKGDVRTFLSRLSRAKLVDTSFGQDLIHASDEDVVALEKLAGRLDGADRVLALGKALPYRFRASDAPAFLKGPCTPASVAESRYDRRFLGELDVDVRPLFMPDLARIYAHQKRVRALLDAAAGAHIRVAGPVAILVLSQLATSGAPLDAAGRDRLSRLAARIVWPDAGDFFFLVPLARDPGAADLVDRLHDEYGYRLNARDASAILRLQQTGIPRVTLPWWVREDHMPLLHPGDLLGADPVSAFADPNDVLFMKSLSHSRPDLAHRPLDDLRGEIRRRIADHAVRYRLGAPYIETTDRLDRFNRADLLKAVLLLDELEHEDVVARLCRWMMRDVADTRSELGGYVRLTPSGRLRFELYPATAGTNDRLLLPPEPRSAALDFHYHATDEDDAEFAGPSSGGPGTDLFRAETDRLDGLVLTKLPGDRFDADLYVSTGSVLDLGVRSGPETAKHR